MGGLEYIECRKFEEGLDNVKLAAYKMFGKKSTCLE